MNKFVTMDQYADYAKKRMPFFAWEYLDSGTGKELATQRNLDALSAMILTPKILQGKLNPDLTSNFLGHSYSQPYGVAPIGMASLMWPGAEQLLAKAALQYNMPFCLSTVAGDSLEHIGDILAEKPALAWYQLYPPRDINICRDIIKRAKNHHFSTLVVTLDVPLQSVRERQLRAGLTLPPKIRPSTIMQSIMRPAWAMNVMRYGKPQFHNVAQYADSPSMADIVQFIRQDLRGHADMDYLKNIRQMWNGKFIVKGILRPEDALMLKEIGVDALWVSNHGGRQCDAAPASISCLPAIKQALQGSSVRVIMDSGLRTGLDILKAHHLGADFTMLGRPFIYGATTDSVEGIGGMMTMLNNDLSNNMIQCGFNNLTQIESH